MPIGVRADNDHVNRDAALSVNLSGADDIIAIAIVRGTECLAVRSAASVQRIVILRYQL